MEKLVSKLAGLGIAGLVLFFVIGTSGLAGAATLTSSLAVLGGPLGMLGGIFTLGLLEMAASGITKYGFDAIAKGVVEELITKGKSKDEIIEEINDFPVISNDLKTKLRDFVNNYTEKKQG